MERRLQRCAVCGEWFNTTSLIMLAHYRDKHQRRFNKTNAIAQLVVERAMWFDKAKYAPWPESHRYLLAAQMTHAQLNLVIQTPLQTPPLPASSTVQS